MDTKRIKELMKAMNDHDVCCLKLKEGENEIELQKGGDITVAPQPVPQTIAASETPPPAPPPPVGEAISSPMVGTFYRSPSPEAEPFVKVGDQVGLDTIVGVVEAMKVMNEVKAGTKGVIRDVLVENGQPIEFGTPLFKVEHA